MNNDFDYDKWINDYHNNKCINILDLISKEDIEIIKRLHIKVEEKIYTKYELEVLYLNLIQYCNDEVDEKELDEIKSLGLIKNLEGTGVSKEELYQIIGKVFPYDIILR